MALIPQTLTAGLTVNIAIRLANYRPPDWSLTLYLRGASFAPDIASVADGYGYRLKVPATATKGWPAGVCAYELRATDGIDVIAIESGTLEIKPDLAAVSGTFDALGHVRKVLAAIEAVIEGRASRDQESYRINNRELQRTPIADLLRLRNEYRRELAREKAAAQGGGLLGRTVRVRV